MKSIVNTVWTNVDIENEVDSEDVGPPSGVQLFGDNNDEPFRTTQRISDDSGTVQVALDQDPGANCDANIVMYGRLASDAPWVAVLTVDLDGTDFDASPFSRIEADVLIPPQFKFASEEHSGGTYNVNAGTDASIWVQE